MTKILYVPLDDRDCNYEFPWLLSKMTEDIELLRPPYEWMGFLKTPAKRDKIWQWIFEQAPFCEYAILSVDTLIYGNIIGSRTHHYTLEECSQTMDLFRQLKGQNPHLHIHAFNLAARVAAYNDSHEDPEYWQDFGYDIWRYTWLLDKQSRFHITAEELQELTDLKEKIPSEILDDFLTRRKTNRLVNLTSVDLVKENVFDILTVPRMILRNMVMLLWIRSPSWTKHKRKISQTAYTVIQEQTKQEALFSQECSVSSSITLLFFMYVTLLFPEAMLFRYMKIVH